MEFEFSLKKNDKLFRERKVTFSDVIESIAEKGVLLDFKHPNNKKYPNQRIFVVEINKYPYCIPYVKQGNKLFLRTIFPSRKFKYLIKDKNNE